MIPDTGNIEIGGGLPSGSKIIRTNANQVRLAADRIKKKYRKQKPTGVLREKKKKNPADWLKHAGYLDTDDLQTVNYNNDTNVGDLQNPSNKNKGIGDAINLKKTSKKAAKKIAKKYRSLARKKP